MLRPCTRHARGRLLLPPPRATVGGLPARWRRRALLRPALSRAPPLAAPSRLGRAALRRRHRRRQRFRRRRRRRRVRSQRARRAAAGGERGSCRRRVRRRDRRRVRRRGDRAERGCGRRGGCPCPRGGQYPAGRHPRAPRLARAAAADAEPVAVRGTACPRLLGRVRRCSLQPRDPACCSLRPRVLQPATPRAATCNPTCCSLQPHVLGAATPCLQPACNPAYGAEPASLSLSLPRYAIQAGAWTAFALPPSELRDAAARQRAYELLNLCYQVG